MEDQYRGGGGETYFSLYFKLSMQFISSFAMVWYGMVWYGMVWYGMVAEMKMMEWINYQPLSEWKDFKLIGKRSDLKAETFENRKQLAQADKQK